MSVSVKDYLRKLIVITEAATRGVLKKTVLKNIAIFTGNTFVGVSI